MTRLKRFRGMAALTVLLGFFGFWTAFAQSAPDLVSVDKIGWWTRRPGAMPYGNPNNFEVASGVQGDESVAALRVLIRGEITKATLVMSEVDAPLAGVNPGKLRACTTDVPWLVADGGAFTAAPKANCDGAVELARSVDANGAATWMGDVTKMLAGARSEVSIMVVPSPDAAAVVPPTYYIKFTARIDAEGTPDVTPTTQAASPPPVPSGGGGSFTSTPRVTAPSGTVTTPAVTTPTTVAATTPTSTPRRFALAAQPKEVKHWGRLVWLIPLAAIGSALYTFLRRAVEQRVATA
jgi:hypothetical protein